MRLLDRLRHTDQRRVAVIGIDGLGHGLVADNPEVFENLGAIAEAGAGGSLGGGLPPAESVCWPVLTTGTNPGRTGIYGFTDREVGSYDTYVPMGGDVQSDHVWDHAEAAGRSATVLNVPVTHPPQRDVQRMVSGYHADGISRAAYPPEFVEYLESIDYRLDTDVGLGRDDVAAFLGDATETLESRHEAFRHCVEADDWELFLGVFTTPDRVSHFLYGDYENDGEYREEFLDFYRTVDRCVGDLRDRLPEEVTTVVASDHGFVGLENEVRCNRWLENEGWLAYRSDPEDLADIAEETRAYALSPGRFYLNLEGREPRGSVPESEYESVRAELKTAIEAIEDPAGEPVVDRVLVREEAFDGPHEDLAPDLVAVPRPGYDLTGTFEADNETFLAGARTGMHAYGDAALLVDDATGVDDGGDIRDVAPTVLDLLDVETDDTVDGHSLV